MKFTQVELCSTSKTAFLLATSLSELVTGAESRARRRLEGWGPLAVSGSHVHRKQVLHQLIHLLAQGAPRTHSQLRFPQTAGACAKRHAGLSVSRSSLLASQDVACCFTGFQHTGKLDTALATANTHLAWAMAGLGSKLPPEAQGAATGHPGSALVHVRPQTTCLHTSKPMPSPNFTF